MIKLPGPGHLHEHESPASPRSSARSRGGPTDGPRPIVGAMPAMIRPRLTLATFALVALGLSTGVDAAETALALFAQTADVPRGPGLYLNLFKFLPVLVIYVLWVWSTHWVDD